jgi:phage head maturation protease
MTKRKKTLYAEIAKTEAQDDGTIKVWGYASSGAEDSDGETITPDAMKAAIPDYMKFGAVREMHQPSAAGTAIEMSVEADGKTWFGAHVVDPVAVKKVETGVYKGFSIGGKVTERDKLKKTTIKAIKLYEVSLVDRPANPEAVFELVKAQITPEEEVEELAALLDDGEVTPGQLLKMIQDAKAVPATDGITELATGSNEPEPVEDATKAATTGSPEVTPLKGVGEPQEPVQAEDVVQKGMYAVSRFAEILTSLGYLAEDATWEASYEKDGSPVPAQIVAWMKSGLSIFSAMAKEEVDEFCNTMNGLTSTVKAAKAEAIGEEALAKAGARFSKSTKTMLSKIHGACKEATAHLDGLGYNDDAEKSATNDNAPAPEEADTNGIPDPVQDSINKAIAPLNLKLTELGKENEELKAKLDKFAKQPAPGKALLKAMSITKAQDTLPDEPTAVVAETPPPEGTHERAQYEMKKVFSQNKRIVG